jgi:hypothetical protein
MVDVPSAFWRRLSYQQIHDLMFVRQGRMTAKEIKLLWRVMKRTDRPPKGFVIDTTSDPEFAATLALLRQLNPMGREPPRELWDELGWNKEPPSDH